MQLSLELFDFLLETRVLTHFLVDLANRVQHGGVIAVPETAPDFGQGALGQVLSQVHANLARAHDRAMPPLREDILLGHGIMP